MQKACADQRSGVEQTLLFWQRRTSKSLSAENAREIVEVISGFFSQLQAWDVRQGSPETDARLANGNITAISHSEAELAEKVCTQAHEPFAA
jgi:hypothetical protein